MTAFEKRYEEIDFTATPAKWTRTVEANGDRVYVANAADAVVKIIMASGREQNHTGCPVGFKLIVGGGDVQVIPS